MKRILPVWLIVLTSSCQPSPVISLYVKVCQILEEGFCQHDLGIQVKDESHNELTTILEVKKLPYWWPIEFGIWKLFFVTGIPDLCNVGSKAVETFSFNLTHDFQFFVLNKYQRNIIKRNQHYKSILLFPMLEP